LHLIRIRFEFENQKKKMSDDAAEQAAKLAKAAAREEKKLKYMTPQQRDDYRREQQQQRKLERIRDKAKAATAREHTSMVDLIERYESESLPLANRDDDDNSDDAPLVDDSSSSKKRKQRSDHDDNDAVDSNDVDDNDNDNADNDDNDSNDARLPSYVDRAAFARYRASKAPDIEREIDKLRRALNPSDRFYDAQVKYVEKRRKQLEAQVRADFIVQQRDAQLHKRHKIRMSHHKRNKRGQPAMRTMINDVLHRLERNGATAVVQPHQIKKTAPLPIARPPPTAKQSHAAHRGRRR
jgi:hypothetical protein